VETFEKIEVFDVRWKLESLSLLGEGVGGN
jgi:hypothetical protein